MTHRDAIPPPPPVPQECSDADLVERAVRAARSPVWRQRPRWASVKRVFCCGATRARELCERFNLDPDEIA